jgi:hypothetical protein
LDELDLGFGGSRATQEERIDLLQTALERKIGIPSIEHYDLPTDLVQFTPGSRATVQGIPSSSTPAGGPMSTSQASTEGKTESSQRNGAENTEEEEEGVHL